MGFLEINDSTLNGRQLRCDLYPFSVVMSLGWSSSPSVSVCSCFCSSFASPDGELCAALIAVQGDAAAMHHRAARSGEWCVVVINASLRAARGDQ